MAIRPIRNDDDLNAALARIEALWDEAAGSAGADELEVLSVLVSDYEARHHAVPPGDPIATISYKLREFGWSQRDLGRRLGWGTGRVSEILNRRRPLTLAMVQQLAAVLEISPGLLVGVETTSLDATEMLAVPAGVAQLARQVGASTGMGEGQVVRAALVLWAYKGAHASFTSPACRDFGAETLTRRVPGQAAASVSTANETSARRFGGITVH
jgi:HTH-type transcriptional regulator/antitoxin HigA